MYKPSMLYTHNLKSKTILGLKLIAKGILGIYINLIGGNRFCFNRMKYRLYLELDLELSPARSLLPFLHLELYAIVI
jgi:hypothetical protein